MKTKTIKRPAAVLGIFPLQPFDFKAHLKGLKEGDEIHARIRIPKLSTNTFVRGILTGRAGPKKSAAWLAKTTSDAQILWDANATFTLVVPKGSTVRISATTAAVSAGNCFVSPDLQFPDGVALSDPYSCDYLNYCYKLLDEESEAYYIGAVYLNKCVGGFEKYLQYV